MYRAYGLLQPNSDFTLEAAESRMRTTFPTAVASRSEHSLKITVGGWDVTFQLNDGPEVLSESIRYAERIAGLTDGTDIESCARRVEASSETPDPYLEHFDKYQQVVGILRSFRGLIAIDPKEPALL